MRVCCDPVVDWHSEQHILSSASETVVWELDQLSGAALRPLADTTKVMRDPAKLQHTGLRMDCSQAGLRGFSADDPRVVWNSELAQLMGSFVMRLISMRIRRMFPFPRGWPRRCVMGLDDKLRPEMERQFKQDYDNHKKIKGGGGRFAMPHMSSRMSRRSRPAVSWSMRRSQTSKRASATHLIEGGFSVQRRAKDKGASPVMVADRICSTLVDKAVSSQRHHFDEANWRLQGKVRNVSLPSKLYRRPLGGTDVVTTNIKISWGPSAIRLGTLRVLLRSTRTSLTWFWPSMRPGRTIGRTS